MKNSQSLKGIGEALAFGGIKNGNIRLILKITALTYKRWKTAPRLNTHERSLFKRRSPDCKHGISIKTEFKRALAVFRHYSYGRAVKLFAEESITIKVGISEV